MMLLLLVVRGVCVCVYVCVYVCVPTFVEIFTRTSYKSYKHTMILTMRSINMLSVKQLKPT